MNVLKRTWIWIRRFRKRRGYGVHSPFAFDFITTVVNERARYYAYDTIKRKSDRLIFRLTNYAQPSVCIEIGSQGAQEAMRIAKPSAQLIYYDSVESFMASHVQEMQDVGLIHLSRPEETMLQAFESIVPLCRRHTLLVIEGIHKSRSLLSDWRRITTDARCVLTFDLYTHGIVMFNPDYIKQNYIVNF